MRHLRMVFVFESFDDAPQHGGNDEGGGDLFRARQFEPCFRREVGELDRAGGRKRRSSRMGFEPRLLLRISLLGTASSFVPPPRKNTRLMSRHARALFLFFEGTGRSEAEYVRNLVK